MQQTSQHTNYLIPIQPLRSHEIQYEPIQTVKSYGGLYSDTRDRNIATKRLSTKLAGSSRNSLFGVALKAATANVRISNGMDVDFPASTVGTVDLSAIHTLKIHRNSMVENNLQNHIISKKVSKPTNHMNTGSVVQRRHSFGGISKRLGNKPVMQRLGAKPLDIESRLGGRK